MNNILPVNIREDFLQLFYHDLQDISLENDNKLNLFTLQISNNSFSYNKLVEILGDKLHYFALSRNEIEKLKNEDKLNTLVTRAKVKFKDYTDNTGELGEVLLYCLLESHLKAPKILSKLEIKTSSEMYVHGADGVHLLKLSNTDYQLIFGESKMDAKLIDGIYDAFHSLKKLLDDDLNKLEFEVNLVESQLIKEIYDENAYKILKRILIPTSSSEEIYTDNSFGIFLGFNIEVTEDEKKLPNPIFREQLRTKIKIQVEETISSINFQIRKNCFAGYNFYIYVIPFVDIDIKRKEIIKKLTV